MACPTGNSQDGPRVWQDLGLRQPFNKLAGQTLPFALKPHRYSVECELRMHAKSNVMRSRAGNTLLVKVRGTTTGQTCSTGSSLMMMMMMMMMAQVSGHVRQRSN